MCGGGCRIEQRKRIENNVEQGKSQEMDEKK
jgi:hypothetical protein